MSNPGDRGQAMDKRRFLKLLLAGGAGTLAARVGARQRRGDVRYLPPPRPHGFSVESVINSRISTHSGFSGPLPDQVLSNVLWAAERAPRIGAARVIYAALPQGVYRYDPARHRLIGHRAGNHLSNPNLAFEVGVAATLVEEAGMCLHFAHLASTAFWSTTANQPSCCPKDSARNNANNSWNPSSYIHLVNSYGRMGAVSGITSQRVATSSDASLPDPATNGALALEVALAGLSYGARFDPAALSLRQIGQLAWAANGCVPHHAYNGYAALSAASYMAQYFLSGRIYIAHSEGLERYWARLPGGQPTTRDHRIEELAGEDRRAALRAALAGLPARAACAFVFCADFTTWNRRVEAGFCGAGALVQARSLGLQGHIMAGFSTAQRAAISSALAIPPADLPLLIFSCGYAEDTER